MDTLLQDFISSIQESHLPLSDKKPLVSELQKNGITQAFADLFKQALSREAQKRGEAAAPVVSDFDTQFTQLLLQFEKESISLEQECAEKISALDPLDTAGEQSLLDTYVEKLKAQRTVYEKKVRDLTVRLAKMMAKLS